MTVERPTGMDPSVGPPDPTVATWSDPERVDGYLRRTERTGPRHAGEEVLASILPRSPRSLLDLGCGDGRLAALVIDRCVDLRQVVVVDSSPPMLDRARLRFAGDPRVTVRRWDLIAPIDSLGPFDVIVSGLAIHHLEDQRKRTLVGEVAAQLTAGGLFANLDVVASATPALHAEFLSLIGRPEDDPEDRLADIGSHLGWMRDAGLGDVDCLWRWRGFALLAGWAR